MPNKATEWSGDASNCEPLSLSPAHLNTSPPSRRPSIVELFQRQSNSTQRTVVFVRTSISHATPHQDLILMCSYTRQLENTASTRRRDLCVPSLRGLHSLCTCVPCEASSVQLHSWYSDDGQPWTIIDARQLDWLTLYPWFLSPLAPIHYQPVNRYCRKQINSCKVQAREWHGVVRSTGRSKHRMTKIILISVTNKV